MSKTGLNIRSSGRNPGKCYLDLHGSYSLSEIAETLSIPRNTLEALVTRHGAQCDDGIGVWYFQSREAAVEALNEIETHVVGTGSGKAVFLTAEEMEYIRQALINEGSNVISVRNELKHRIFDKFNR